MSRAWAGKGTEQHKKDRIRWRAGHQRGQHYMGHLRTKSVQRVSAGARKRAHTHIHSQDIMPVALLITKDWELQLSKCHSFTKALTLGQVGHIEGFSLHVLRSHQNTSSMTASQASHLIILVSSASHSTFRTLMPPPPKLSGFGWP